MCYSAQIWADYRKFRRHFGAKIDIKEFFQVYWLRNNEPADRKPPTKIPKGMDLPFLNATEGIEGEIAELIRAYNAGIVAAAEPELFKQRKRLADNERKLALKPTKTASEEVRKAKKAADQQLRWIADAKRTEPEPERDDRIFPNWYVPVLIVENGERVVKPMRYHCRPCGMPASSDWTKDRKVSGKYNARRDNLERFWRGLFGHSHGLILADTFYEMVGPENGPKREIQFTPRTGETMYVACLWSHWTDPTDAEPDLLSVAAVTDDPEPEVAAAGHDRTIINLKPEHVDAWLNPDPRDLGALQAILDDKRHPFYEHRLAA